MSSQSSLMRRALRLDVAAVTLAALALVTACKKNDGEAPNGGYVQGQVGTSPGGSGAMPAGGAPAGVGGAPATPAAVGGATASGPAPMPTQAGPIAQRLDA